MEASGKAHAATTHPSLAHNADKMMDPRVIRGRLSGLPEGTSHGDATPGVSDVYFPRSHVAALNPNTLIVKGMRGAGKTFWWNALQDRNVRTLIGERETNSQLSQSTEIRTGFGEKILPNEYPSKDVLAELLAKNMDARIIWRTVLAWHVAPLDDGLHGLTSWRDRCTYVQANSDTIDMMIHERDAELDRQGTHLLVLFDALDRCADDWDRMCQLIRGLIQVALDVRSCRRIRVKIFLRSDQADEARIRDFADASKVFPSSVELNWPLNELYGLLWHYMANSDNGADIRDSLDDKAPWKSVGINGHTVFAVPREFVFGEHAQRECFHAIAGPWMDRNPRRGFPYTWIPNHLADTEGKVSPRSFLAALRTAARDTDERHPEHKYALHYDSIKQGVREASTIRVRELREEYPWMQQVLGSLQGMAVPCAFEEVKQRWAERDVFRRLALDMKNAEVKLVPRHVDQGPHGVRKDLENMNIFQRLRDGRVNIPDVFRVGYGLGRRGGVKPVRPAG